MHCAIEQGHVEIVALLIKKYEAKTDIPDANGKTALVLIKESKDQKIKNIIELHKSQTAPSSPSPK